MKTATPRIYLGTMTFGWSQTSSIVDESVAKEMVKKFISFNKKNCIPKHYIDTARIYAGGATEPIVGKTITDSKSYVSLDSISMGTKAHPSQPNGLSAVGIKEQIDKSLLAMGEDVNSIGEYYLHQPDTENSLLESLKCIDGLIKEEKVSELGMSNYHASEMKRAFTLCKEHGLTPPSVYQGLYNPLNRMVEEELLPILKENNCSFVAYNPLAAGLLTGKHKNISDVMKGRFHNNDNYLPRFYTESNFKAIKLVQAACDEEDITMLEATFRWLLKHSALSEKDGILLGASSLTQLDENLDACSIALEKGPLPESILKAFDEAWEITRESSFPYWRSYSSDMPNGKNLDQGASYSAAKK